MPAFSPDTTPVVKQYQRRRSVYQSLAALNPLDFLHLHRERFRPTPTQPSRAERKESLASPKGPASRGFRFSLRRRRGPASRVVIHQTKLPVAIREAEVEDELPSYEESVSQGSCMNCDAANSAATTTEDTITGLPSYRILARPHDALNAYFANPHRPRLTGRWRKCGATRGVRRHFNAERQVLHTLVSSIITRSGNNGMITPYNWVDYGFHPGDGREWDRAALEGWEVGGAVMGEDGSATEEDVVDTVLVGRNV
ncbi:uncharacterized protein DFL_002564 [Arthrobotrys flagrans]|uniref:Uncharacterized protein n=1 Tax=Arthrobotrys flagrans TaxID=97331 RepID=A0A437AC01_ARTFL|nr:hypothetical protein DFL_002564 [Arthrobotrys flagrans]